MQQGQAGSDLSYTNLVSGETLNLTGSGVLDSPAAGSRTIVNVNTLSISDGSGAASNYTLTNGTLTMTILPRTTSVSGTKVYDGTTTVRPENLTVSLILQGQILCHSLELGQYLLPTLVMENQ